RAHAYAARPRPVQLVRELHRPNPASLRTQSSAPLHAAQDKEHSTHLRTPRCPAGSRLPGSSLLTAATGDNRVRLVTGWGCAGCQRCFAWLAALSYFV